MVLNLNPALIIIITIICCFSSSAEGRPNRFPGRPRDRGEIGVSVFSGEVLDKLITRSIQDEVKMEAIASARAKCHAMRSWWPTRTS